MAKVPPTKKKKKESKNHTPNDGIFIQGARMHNLRNVYVEIPRNKLTVVTGVSGSGKSSLTIDTLYAEGQRRYAESLSAYARQFLMRMDKPDVDHISGLCPAVAIEQKVVTRTPRSTVGSMTEIYEYLRLLFARVGRTISPISGREAKKDDVKDVLHSIRQLKTGEKFYILSPLRFSKNRKTIEELNILLQKGFSRIYDHTQKNILPIDELIDITKWEMSPSSFLLVDRLISKKFDEEEENRIADSIALAFYEGEGSLVLVVNEETFYHFSNRFEQDGILFEEPVPNLFAFNNPYGACPICEGYSQILGIDKDLVIPNHRLSVYDGAVAPWKGDKLNWWREQFMKGAASISFPIHKPYEELTEKQKDALWNGHEHAYGIHDFFKEVEQNLYKMQFRVLLSRYRGRTTCTSCNGYRLRKEALYVKLNGKHIGELCSMPIIVLADWFNSINLTAHERIVAKRILIEINQRIETLLDVGLGYLTLDRLANSLSGGESQRIQLTRCLGSNLTNSLYILDEPSIGLHSRDTENLIKVLKKLRDLGNTVVVVEHDESMMRSADHIIDMGPLASHLGGEVVGEGNFEQILSSDKSLTARYLKGILKIDTPHHLRIPKQFINIEGATENNLKNINVRFPLGIFTVISGVSGSGKTTLVKKVLYPAIEKHLTGISTEKVGSYRSLSGDLSLIQQIEMIDQNPIGKSSRSNPVTYIKAWDSVRELYASQPLSKIRGYQPKHFSFNVDGGRCDACKGEGEQLIEMQFLADVHLTCESCNGKRFKEDVLEVTYMSKNIHDILEMSIDEAIEFMQDHKDVSSKLKPLSEVGLGYVKLGQSSDTLSGGEAQRVKLASFLGKGSHKDKILFIFDEPTTGLHFHDINKLLKSFHALIEQGHTIIVIEHNIDVIKSADWLIELGPEAGDEGGAIVYEGTPSGIRKMKQSRTAPFL